MYTFHNISTIFISWNTYHLLLQKSLQYTIDCNMVLLLEEDVEAHTGEIFVHKFENMVDHFLMAMLKLHPWMQMNYCNI